MTMQLPIDALMDTLEQDRIRFPAARPPRRDGLSVLPIDFTILFGAFALAGRDAGLLLLVLRTIRQRGGDFGLTLQEVAAILRAREDHVRRWLATLAEHRFIVFDLRDKPYGTSVDVEFPSPDVAAAREPLLVEMPTHCTLQWLPLLHRRAFALYLCFVGAGAYRDRGTISLSSACRLIGVSAPRARLLLWKLRRYGLLVRTNGEWTVNDPPPLTERQHARLRRHRNPAVQAGRRVIDLLLFLLGLALAAAAALLNLSIQ